MDRRGSSARLGPASNPPEGTSLRRVAGVLVLSLAGTAGQAQPLRFAVDPVESHVRIHLGRAGLFGFLGHDHTIEAPIAEGHVEADAGDVRYSRVRLRFETRLLAVVPGTEPAEDIPKVEERMRSPEVLDVERYPEVVFTSTAVAGEAEEAGRYRLRLWGTLELMGERRELTFPFEVRRENDRMTAAGEVELRLRQLGIEPPSVAGVVKVADRFRIAFDIRARPEPAPEP